MKISDVYKTYREAGIKLNGKITDKVLREFSLDDAVRLLGFDKQGRTVIFDSEFEMDVLHDFMVFDSVKDGKRAIDIYKEKYSTKNEIEEKILNSFIKAYTSLFRILNVQKEDNVIWLSDILNEGIPIRLVDVRLSLSTDHDILLFTRLIPFEDFCMTSGVSFVFELYLEKYLLKRYKKIIKKIDGNESLKRFIAFFKLNKDCGREVHNEFAS